MDNIHAQTTPSEKELKYLRKRFNEAAYMGGTKVKYRPVISRNLTSVSSEVYEWGEPIDNMYIIYDERPKVSTLKRLNWYTEDTEIQPRLMYIPCEFEGKTINVRRGDLIYVKNPLRSDEDDIFQVSVSRVDLVAVNWVCNVVPYRDKAPVEAKQTINNQWLNT